MNKMNERKTRHVFRGQGWYRIAEYKAVTGGKALGDAGNGVLIKINSAYNTGGNVSILVSLNAVYKKSNFTVLGECDNFGINISKIRHTVDIVNNIAYLEYYYDNTSTLYTNAVLTELLGYRDVFSAEWVLLKTPVSTQDFIENVEIYSTVDIKSKDREIITNSDLVYKELTSVEFSPVANIIFHRSYYFRTGKMVNVYLDFTVNNGFPLNANTVISSDILPSSPSIAYCTIDNGYCYVIGKKIGVFVRKEGRYFANFLYPTS